MIEGTVDIRKATPADHDQIWEIIQPVLLTGDTYVFAPDSSREKMLAYWCGLDRHTYVATINGTVVGTFLLRDNQPDLGSHIANGSYMTLKTASGQGIGKAMGAFSIEEARRLGYKAMQFNIVIKSNERAVRLWQTLGFTIIGEIPDAFNHRQNGLTNAYIMYRKL
jgi:ribosomal protein S18 acetylase RimI-like enzyme